MKEEKDNIKEAKQEAEAMEATRETEQANETPKPETEETCTNTAEGVEEEEASNETSGEKDELTAAQEEIAQLKDKYLRSVAEFDNYRKRTLKEKAELILNGSEKAVQAILPIIDDMERAIANAEKTDDVNVLREGMQLIYQKTNKIMESLGVKKIETDNADFDTNFHEAVAMVPGMGDDKKGKVLDCVQTGYTLNDKVIRHAKVAVGQ
ncbi:nucleotide exchange factor GrpE [Marseilla massiliensis]|nr:nucleotide exchange factor GrpE [Marseilla massiliensis]CCY65835.1 protein GrpE [Prevotella sp. CAG:1124]